MGVQNLSYFFFKNRKRRRNDALSHDDNDVLGLMDGVFYSAKNLSDLALGIIPHNRIADFSGGDYPQPLMIQTIVQPKHRADIVYLFLLATIHHVFKLKPLEQSLVFAKRSVWHAQTASRFRPFLLLLDRTFLPPALAIRARNPCVRFLLMFDG